MPTSTRAPLVQSNQLRLTLGGDEGYDSIRVVRSIHFLLILCSLVPSAWMLLLYSPACSPVLPEENEGGAGVDGDDDDDNNDDGVEFASTSQAVQSLMRISIRCFTGIKIRMNAAYESNLFPCLPRLQEIAKTQMPNDRSQRILLSHSLNLRERLKIRYIFMVGHEI